MLPEDRNAVIYGREGFVVGERVARWFIAGQRKKPTGVPPGRPKGAKDARPRKPYESKNLPTPT